MATTSNDLHSYLAGTAKSLEAMLNYTRTVQRVTSDLTELSQYFATDTPIGRRMRDLLHEMADNMDIISDTSNKATR